MLRIAWLCAFLMVALASVPAHAGQLSIEHYGLAEVMRTPGIAFLGGVVAVDAVKSTLTVLIKKVWLGAGHTAQLSRYETKIEPNGNRTLIDKSVSLVVGERVTVPIYRGIVWDDPHRSPIDHRLRGALRFEELRAGADVIVLGQEAVSPTPAEKRKVELFFGEQIPKVYPTQATKAVLAADLSDFDLGKLAYDELVRRKELSLAMLLPLVDVRDNELLWNHFQALDAAGQKAFLAEASRLLATRREPTQLEYLARMMEFKITPALAPEVARLLLLLDDADRDQKRLFASLAKQLEELDHAAPLAPDADVTRVLLRAHAPTDEPKSREELVAFATGLRPAARAHLIDELLSAARRDLEHQGGAALPSRWLGPLTDLVVAEPDPRLAKPIASLPFLRLTDFGRRESVARELIAMAVALAKRDPKTIPVLKGPLEKLLKSDQSFMSKPETKGGNTIEVGIVLTVESQLGGDDIEEYRRLFRGKN